MKIGRMTIGKIMSAGWTIPFIATLLSAYSLFVAFRFCIIVTLLPLAPWHSPWWYIALVGVYTSYYLSVCAVKPAVIISSRHATDSVQHRLARLMTGSKSLQGRGYYPTPYLLNHNLQTLYSVVGRPSPVFDMRRDVREGFYADGGAGVMDFAPAPDGRGRDDILVVVFHGVAGNSRDLTVRGVTRALHIAGYDVVIPIRRGCVDDVYFDTLKPYPYGDIADTIRVMTYIAQRFPARKLVGVGLSAGSNVLVNYLAGSTNLLLGGVSVANGFCWDRGTEALERDHPVWYRVLSRHVGYTMYERNKSAIRHSPVVPLSNGNGGDDVADDGGRRVFLSFPRSFSLRQLDDIISREVHGYTTLEEYYRDQSCIHRIDQVRAPVVFLNAMNDPIASSVVPIVAVANNPSALLVTTRSGGHLGYPTGWVPFRRSSQTWLEAFVVDAVRAVLDVAEDNANRQGATIPPVWRGAVKATFGKEDIKRPDATIK